MSIFFFFKSEFKCMKGNPPVYETYMCVQSENIVVGGFLFVFDFFLLH